VISIFYYFSWIKAAFFESWRPAREVSPAPAPPARPAPAAYVAVTLSALALATVVLGFFQSPLTVWLFAR
jgi:NADH-quinone oxidoreductase subunit N